MKTILISPNFPYLFQEPCKLKNPSRKRLVVLARLRAEFEFSLLARRLYPANDSELQLLLIEGGQP